MSNHPTSGKVSGEKNKIDKKHEEKKNYEEIK